MSINRSILKLAVPSILANITVPIVGMVDMAVAGHLEGGSETLTSAAMIGGIAIGTMLFDLLYWNFGFLRIGTGGLAAQAYGREDMGECARILLRGTGMALIISVILLAIQWIFLKGAFYVVDCTPEVRELASRYFLIRIWAAPATLTLMAFKGWFIGMQDSISPMLTDLVVNGMNILLSVFFSIGVTIGGVQLIAPMGFAGIAIGTVTAQWLGLIVGLLLVGFKYFNKSLRLLNKSDVLGIFNGQQTRRFFVMNVDLFIRSACMIAVYIGFTTISAKYGDTLLAASSILMKLLLLFSYFTDGFAYAGEALTGRYIGEKNSRMLGETVKWTFIWSMGIAMIFVLVYLYAGDDVVRLMTSDQDVVKTAENYLMWLLLMPFVGCAAFTWDGIYVGATASKGMRNSSLWAVAAFIVVWAVGIHMLDMAVERSASQYGIWALHILMAAYFAHLFTRTIYLTFKSRSSVFSSIS